MPADSTLAEAVAGTLLESILRGEVPLGGRLIELTLAADLGVSQNTVRDALRLLEHGGWVIKQPRHGVFVRSFTPAQTAEVIALLDLLSKTLFHALQGRLLRPALPSLQASIRAAQQTAVQGDIPATLRLIFSELDGLAQLCDRPLTADLFGRTLTYARLLEADAQNRQPWTRPALHQLVEAAAALVLAIEYGPTPQGEQRLHVLLSLLGDHWTQASK